MQVQDAKPNPVRSWALPGIRLSLLTMLVGLSGIVGCEVDDEDEIADVREADVNGNEIAAPDVPEVVNEDMEVDEVDQDTREARRPVAPVDLAERDDERTVIRNVRTTSWNVDREGRDGGGMVIEAPGPDGGTGLIVRRNQPSEVRAGETLRYTIEVENASPTPMHDVTVREWREGGLEVQKAGMKGRQAERMENDGQQQGQAQTMGDRWSIDLLPAGETRTIEVVGVAPQEGRIQTCMAISYEPAVCLVTDVVKPDLVLRRQVDENRAYVCDDIGVTYMVENVGSATARDVVVTEELPDGLESARGGRIRFTIGEIGPGEMVERQAMLTASSSGQYSSHATLEAGDLQARSSESQLVFVRPQLELTLDAPREEYVGRDVPIRMTLRNTGDAPAMETVVRLSGIEGVSRPSLSTSRAQLEGNVIRVGEIAAGESRDMTLLFDAEQPRTRDITATVNAYCAASVSREASIQLMGVEAVRLETIDLVDPVVVGEETVYDVQVKNQGTADSINVNVTATLPQEMTFVEASGDSNVRADGQTLQFGTIKRLPPGEVASWKVRVRAESAAKTQLKLELTSDATRRPAHEQEPTTIIEQAHLGGGR